MKIFRNGLHAAELVLSKRFQWNEPEFAFFVSHLGMSRWRERKASEFVRNSF